MTHNDILHEITVLKDLLEAKYPFPMTKEMQERGYLSGGYYPIMNEDNHRVIQDRIMTLVENLKVYG